LSRQLHKLFAAAVCCWVVSPALAQELDPEDLEDRADYAYFTQDAGALRNLIRESTTTLAKGSATAQARYVLGFANYRLGMVIARRDASGAAAAMEKCVDELDEAIDEDRDFAEAYALQSACYGQLAALRTLSAVISGPKSGSRLEKAQKLAPRNPRVVLVQAMGEYERPKAFGGDKVKALATLRRAVELFDQSQKNEQSGFPSWGAADAHAALGRSLLESGDALGARNALERALIVAPEFAEARALLAKVTGAK